MNDNIEYRLGHIDAKLQENDRAHATITNYLYTIQTSIDRVEESISATKVDIAGIKGKASVWGTIAGFLTATFVTIIGWFVLRR